MQPPADLLARVRTLRPQDPKALADLRADARRKLQAPEAVRAQSQPGAVAETAAAPTEAPPNTHHTRGGAIADVHPPRRDPEPAPNPFALDGLPGAGPGLIWKLRQIGILSLRDLAHADPVELGRRLGAIGKLVAVGPWIDFARKRLLEQVD